MNPKTWEKYIPSLKPLSKDNIIACGLIDPNREDESSTQYCFNTEIKQNCSVPFRGNSLVIYTNEKVKRNTDIPGFKAWFESLKDTYIVDVFNKGKTGDYRCYGICLVNYTPEEIDQVFIKFVEIAEINKRQFYENRHRAHK